MPSYDFVCTRCETAFEKRMSMSAYSEGEGRECPSCGSAEVERAFTAVNVISSSRSAGSWTSSGTSCGPAGFT